MSNRDELANIEEEGLEVKLYGSENDEGYAEKVDAYIGQFKEGYFSPLAMMARLTEEMGDLQERLIIIMVRNRRKQLKQNVVLKSLEMYYLL